VIFLQPLLLALGVLIGVPFIIHLLGERKYQALSFSSLKFLREIEHDSLQKLQLRQWLILLSRALWISMLVLALAQPFLSKGEGSLEPGILILDKSFSTRIDKNFLSGEKTLTGNFPRWDVIVYNERANPDSLREEIRLNIERNKRETPNIILLSDFQKNVQNEEIIEIIKAHTTRVFGISLEKNKENFALSRLRLIDESIHLEDMKSIEIQLSQNDQTPIPPAIDINLNGTQIGRAGINEEGYGYFHFTVPENDHIPCFARCTEDEYPEDNIRYLVINNKTKTKILCVNETNEINYYIKALQAMDRVSPTMIIPQKLTSVDIDQFDMIWFSNLYFLSPNTMRAIKDFSTNKPVLITTGKQIVHPNGWEMITGDLVPIKQQEAYFRIKKIPGVTGSEDLRIKRYYQSSRKSEHIIWALASKDPLLMETEKNIYLLLSPFHFDWNEMGLSPYFTRAISGLIAKMLDVQELSYDIGETIPIKEPFSTMIAPTGENYQVKDEFTHTSTPGFYTIENSKGRTSVAVNIPGNECIQDQIENENIYMLKWEGENIADIEKQIKGRNSQTLFYILSLLFIIFEMLLLRKGERTK